FGTTGTSGQSNQGAAGAEVPHGRTQSEKSRHKPDVTGSCAFGGDTCRFRGGSEDAQVVPQPFDAAAGREHDRLDAPGRRPVDPESHDRECAVHALPGTDRTLSRPGALVQHAARAEGGFGEARTGAALPDEGRLLIACNATNGWRARKGMACTDGSG